MRRADTESSAEAPEDLTSRTDVKRANRAEEETLARLSATLYEIGPRRLAALALPAPVHATVMEAHAIRDARGRRRQLRLVRVALRGSDWSAIQARVQQLTEGRTPLAPAQKAEDALASAAAAWVARLLGEGFAGLDAFLAEYPRTDRARLLDLIHHVDRSTQEKRAKAEQKLADVVAEILVRGRR
jgi:ribosome-associated protein